MQREVRVLSIDAWADGEDSWTWNAWYEIGKVPATVCDLPEAEVISYLIGEGYLKPAATTSCCVDDDQYNVVVCDKETLEPLIALEYGALMDEEAANE